MLRMDVCPRCGGAHKDIDAKPVEHAIMDDLWATSHWFTCPATQEPVLVAVCGPWGGLKAYDDFGREVYLI